MPQPWTPSTGTGQAWTPTPGTNQRWTPGANVTYLPPIVREEGHRWVVHARDLLRRRQAQVRHTNIEATLRYNAVGAWVIDVNRAIDAELLNASGAGVIIERDGETVCSGPVTNTETSWKNGERTWTFEGVTDEHWLDARVTIPEPANSTMTYATAVHAITDVASTAILEYVDLHAGAGALPARVVGGLTLDVDPAVGGSRTWRARFSPLIEVCARICRKASPRLGFRVVQDGTDLLFSVFAPRDLTDSVVFSPSLGNVAEWSYTRHRGEANTLYAGGDGARELRLFAQVIDTAGVAEWEARIERFQDHRDDDTEAELLASAEASLLEFRGGWQFDAEIVERQFLWPSDWQLGDTVRVVTDEFDRTEQVREITIAVDADGEMVSPTIGTEGSTRARLLAGTDARRFARRFAQQLARDEAAL